MSNVTDSPSHCQAGVPEINIQSTLRTAPDLRKNVSLHCYLVATVINIQSVLRQIYIYIYIYIYRVSQEECARLREGVPYVKI